MGGTKNKGIPNIFKFIFLVVALIPLIFFVAKRNHEAIEAFEAKGEVVKIEWNSRDHGMPIISIMQRNRIKLFKGNRITIDSDDLVVGDHFVKLAGSKECKINDELIRCIN